jgi:CRP/FNR family transcriptional regulator
MAQNINKLLHALPLFSELDEDELDNIASKSTFLRLKRGELLFSTGFPATHVYIIVSGSTKLVRPHPDGKERIVHLLIRGEMFGAVVAMQGGYYPVNAVALEESTIMKVEAKIFSTFFLSHPKVGRMLISQIGERMQQAHSDRVLSFDSVDKRIAVFLLDLFDQVQTVFGKTRRIPIPLTRQDIADRVGSTVETVIRILSQWSKQNLIITKDKYIEIPDSQNLRKSINIV